MKTNESKIVSSIDFGQSNAILQNKGDNPLTSLMVELTEEVIDRLKSSLKKRDINTSSQTLSQSINISAVNFSMNFYWKYINYGVNGRKRNVGAPRWGKAPSGDKSFLKAIQEWIPQRGLMKPSRFKTYDEFAKAIMFSVINKGKEARPFVQDVINPQLVKELSEPISKLIGKAITVNIVNQWQ